MLDALRENLKYDKARNQMLTLFTRDIQTNQPRKLNYSQALVLLYCMEASSQEALFTDACEHLKKALGFTDADIRSLMGGEYDPYITRLDNRAALTNELNGLVRELVFSSNLGSDRIAQLENAILARDGAVFAIMEVLQSCAQGKEPAGWWKNIDRAIRLIRQIPSPVEKNMEYLLTVQGSDEEWQSEVLKVVQSELAGFREEKATETNVFKRAIEAMKSVESSAQAATQAPASMAVDNAKTGKAFKDMGREEGVAYITEMSASKLIDLIQRGEYNPEDLTWLCSRMVNKLVVANETDNRGIIEKALRVFGNDRMAEHYRSVNFLQPNEAERLFTQLMLEYAARPREENLFKEAKENKIKYANKSMVFRVLTMSTPVPEAEGQLWAYFNETQKNNPAFQNALASFSDVEQASVILNGSDLLGEPVRWLAAATNTDADTVQTLSGIRLFMIKGTFDYQSAPVAYSACYYFSRMD
jgi:hypothetical protein